jgi:hypothetical protein
VGGRAHDCFLSFMAALDTDANKGLVLDLDSGSDSGKDSDDDSDDEQTPPYAPRCITGSSTRVRLPCCML